MAPIESGRPWLSNGTGRLWSRLAIGTVVGSVILLRIGGNLLSPTSALPAAAAEDQIGQVWFFWWVKRSMMDGWGSPLFTQFLNHPQGTSVAAGFGYYLHALLSLPLQSMAGPVVAANLLYSLAFLWSAGCLYALCREVSANRAVAALCAVLGTLSPWVLDRFELTGMTTEFFDTGAMSLCVLLLLRARNGGLSYAVGGGLLLGLAFWTEVHHGIYVAALVALMAAKDLLVAGEATARRTVWRTYGVAGATAALAAAPWALVVASHLLRYSPATAGPMAVRAPGGSSAAAALAGQTWFFGYATPLTWGLGLSILLLLGVTFVACWLGRHGARRADLRFWWVAVAVFGLYSVGTKLSLTSADGRLVVPLAADLVRRYVPFLGRDMWPDRWFQISILLSAVGLSALWRTLRGRAVPRAIAAMALGGLLAAVYLQQHLHSRASAPHFFPPNVRGSRHLWSLPVRRGLPVFPPWLRSLSRGSGPAAILHLPYERSAPPRTRKEEYWYAQTIHERPILNRLIPTALVRISGGGEGRGVALYLDQVLVGEADRRMAPARIATLRRLGVGHVVVHRCSEAQLARVAELLGRPVHRSRGLAAFAVPRAVGARRRPRIPRADQRRRRSPPHVAVQVR